MTHTKATSSSLTRCECCELLGSRRSKSTLGSSASEILMRMLPAFPCVRLVDDHGQHLDQRCCWCWSGDLSVAAATTLLSSTAVISDAEGSWAPDWMWLVDCKLELRHWRLEELDDRCLWFAVIFCPVNDPFPVQEIITQCKILHDGNKIHTVYINCWIIIIVE